MEKKTTFFTADNVQLKNFKGITDFKGRLHGECCLIIGSEQAGKTNLLQAIFMILRQYPSALVTQGEDEGSAKIEISKGETKYLFKFSFEDGDKDPKLRTIVDGERVTVHRQTEIIKSLTPKTFNLNELISTTGKKQSELILTAFGIDVSGEEDDYQNAFNERKAARRSLDEASNFPSKEKIKRMDTKVLREEISLIRASNGVITEAQTKLGGYKEREKEIRKQLKEIEASIKKGEDFLKEKGKPIDLVEKEEKLASSEVVNERAKDYEDYLIKIEAKKKKQTIVQQWETKVKDTSAAIINKINTAKLPVKGMKIKTDISETSGRVSSVLTYNDLPFDASSVNTAERIAIAAHLQMNLFEPNNLAVVIVDAGSIGNSTIKSISEECEKRGMQCLFELTSKDDNKQLQIETILKK